MLVLYLLALNDASQQVGSLSPCCVLDRKAESELRLSGLVQLASSEHPGENPGAPSVYRGVGAARSSVACSLVSVINPDRTAQSSGACSPGHLAATCPSVRSVNCRVFIARWNPESGSGPIRKAPQSCWRFHFDLP